MTNSRSDSGISTRTNQIRRLVCVYWLLNSDYYCIKCIFHCKFCLYSCVYVFYIVILCFLRDKKRIMLFFFDIHDVTYKGCKKQQQQKERSFALSFLCLLHFSIVLVSRVFGCCYNLFHIIIILYYCCRRLIIVVVRRHHEQRV